MKKIITLMVIAVMVLSIAACGGTGMELSVAKLNDDEQAMMELMKYSKDTCILDFKVDDTIKSVKISTWKLDSNGKWKDAVTGQGHVVSDAEGRISVAYTALPESLFSSCSGGSGAGAFKETSKELAVVTTQITESAEIQYGKPIPVVIQVQSKKDAVSSAEIDDYYGTKDLLKKKHSAVYVVTVTFSQKALS